MAETQAHTPESWALANIEEQRDAFRRTGKTPRFDQPTEKTFPNNDDREQAIVLQKKLCDKPRHIGERAMPRSMLVIKTNECKQCKVIKKWTFDIPPLPLPCTGDEFILFWRECQIRQFEQVDDHMGAFYVPFENIAPETFASDDDREQARRYVESILSMKEFCASSKHTDENRFILDDAEKSSYGWKCRNCVNLLEHERRGNRKKERTVVFSSAEEFILNVAHTTSDKHPDIIGHCRQPRLEEFVSVEEFETAITLVSERNDEYKRQFCSMKEQREKDNAKHRENYAHDKIHNPEKIKRKREQDDVNTAARKKAALDCGNGWCTYGSHAVLPDMIRFCPVEDLGLDMCVRGIRNHYACRNHFAQYALYSKENILENPRDPFRTRLTDARSHCKRRGIEWKLTDEEAMSIFTADQCHYCDTPRDASIPLGIDRVDPFVSEYAFNDNLVASCAPCNMMKSNLDLSAFVTKCHEIQTYHETGVGSEKHIPYRQIRRQPASKDNGATDASLWSHSDVEWYTIGDTEWMMCVVPYEKSLDFSQYKSSATKKGHAFELDECAFSALKKKPCVFCGLQDPINVGIDRIDCSRGYTVENSQSACTTCNMMRKNVAMEDFVQQACKVASAATSRLAKQRDVTTDQKRLSVLTHMEIPIEATANRRAKQ